MNLWEKFDASFKENASANAFYFRQYWQAKRSSDQPEWKS